MNFIFFKHDDFSRFKVNTIQLLLPKTLLIILTIMKIFLQHFQQLQCVMCDNAAANITFHSRLCPYIIEHDVREFTAWTIVNLRLFRVTLKFHMKKRKTIEIFRKTPSLTSLLKNVYINLDYSAKLLCVSVLHNILNIFYCILKLTSFQKSAVKFTKHL